MRTKDKPPPPSPTTIPHPVDFLLSVQRFLCLLQCFVSASLVSYVAFVLSMYVPHLPFGWYFGKAIISLIGLFLGK